MGSLNEDEVKEFLLANPSFIKEWLTNQADNSVLENVEQIIKDLKETRNDEDLFDETNADQSHIHHGKYDDNSEGSDTMSNAPSPSVVPRTGRKSVTSDLFHQWLTASPRSPAAGNSGVTFCVNTTTIVTQGASDDNNSDTDGSPTEQSNFEVLDQNDRLIELILDISNELDINVLCHKILLNVGQLTQADRCSLFLARGPRDKRYLEAKLFDVGANTSLEEALDRANRERIQIPFGLGICGHVAKTKETINLRNAYEDPRFNREIDGKTGYSTHSLVCMPVCNYDGEVIGVAQIINKRGSQNHEFTEKDLKVFQRYLTFCGIGLQNAQLFEVSILEYKKNQLLLSLARNLFQEQMSLERLVTTIIREAKDLLKCERCTVYLLDLKMYDAINNPKTFLELVGPVSDDNYIPGTHLMDDKTYRTEMSTPSIMYSEDSQSTGSGSQTEGVCHLGKGSDTGITFQRVWELTEESTEVHVFGSNDKDLQKSRRARIAKYVATTAEVLNLSSVANWLGENLEDRDGFVPKTMLCLPIFNGQRDVIGVAQLINKKQGTAFGESDIALFEAFAIFCGIGIHNTKMYEGACKLMAKQKVALDCLSYHAAANDQDTEMLAKTKIPPADAYQLYSFKFIDADLNDEETFKVTLRMFLEFDLVSQFHIPYKVLCRWILSVKKNYRPVKYHNWRHALNVCQTMFTVLKTGKLDRFMNDLEVFGLLVACLCHDLDHRGTNNAFESKVESPLAILYSTSTMEHHHFDQCVMILNSEGNNIFQGLGTSDYKKVMRVVEQAILATDLALYFKRKDQFLDTANKGEIDWQGQDKKDLLCGMLMTASDVSAIAKPWEIQHKLAKRVADEFFDQGDMEKLRLNTQPIAMMDRERKDELPQMQVEFIDVVCRPLYSSLSESFPWIKPLLDGCLANREKWADLAEKVEMGLTWIDHDTIEKPIEEITVGTGEAQDIEFTVETLKCNNEAIKKQGNGLTKKRSFRAAKSPIRASHHYSGKGGSFFHRRLSTKSPNRGNSSMATTEINLDERRSSNFETSTMTTQSVGGDVNHTVADQAKVIKDPCIPRSTSNPHQVDTSSSSSYSTSETAPSARGGRRRAPLGQSLSIDNDDYPTTLMPPEIVVSIRGDPELKGDVQRKGSASSEGSSGGRKSPRERLVHKMSKVFK